MNGSRRDLGSAASPQASEEAAGFIAPKGKRPHVAIIGTRGYPSYYGGFETAVRKLAPYLIDQGWDVTVYGRAGSTSPSDPSKDSRVRTVQTWGVERKSISTLSYGLSSCIDAARKKPDVALVMNIANGYWLPILNRASVPTLVNVDGIEWDRAKWGRLAKKVFHQGAIQTAKSATRLVFDSRVIESRWQREFSRDGVFIPYGGDTPAASLPLEPGLSHRGYVLIVARFVPENTVPEFFAAVREIAPHIDVVIVGSSGGYGGSLESEAAALDSEHKKVRWLKHINDDARLQSLWQHAGAYFHGHSVGGTNPALVQAMAAGSPVVALDTPYNREVLGSEGRFVSANSSSIASSLLSLLRDPSTMERLSSEGSAKAHEEYTWELVCRRYSDNLRDLMK